MMMILEEDQMTKYQHDEENMNVTWRFLCALVYLDVFSHWDEVTDVINMYGKRDYPDYEAKLF